MKRFKLWLHCLFLFHRTSDGLTCECCDYGKENPRPSVVKLPDQKPEANEWASVLIGYSGCFDGIKGIRGYSGFTGFSGYSGYSGVSGYSGFMGYSGYSWRLNRKYRSDKEAENGR